MRNVNLMRIWWVMDLQQLSKRASMSGVNESGAAVVHLITSPCTYYHYLCDDIDDTGWGCGYRSLQSLCSWAVEQGWQTNREEGKSERSITGDREYIAAEERHGGACVPGERVWRVPSVREIQETLVNIGDKPPEFVDSRDWIGCFEACLVLDHLFSVACKIVHVSSGGEVVNQVGMLAQHFDCVGSPVMIGGDVDGSSKTLTGVSVDQSNPRRAKFLIADPHYTNTGDSNKGNTASCAACEDSVLLSDRGMRWHGLEIFQTASFYNFCLPQLVMIH